MVHKALVQPNHDGMPSETRCWRRICSTRRLARTERMMVRWMCGVSLKNRLSSEELNGRLGVDGVANIVRRCIMRCFGHLKRKGSDFLADALRLRDKEHRHEQNDMRWVCHTVTHDLRSSVFAVAPPGEWAHELGLYTLFTSQATVTNTIKQTTLHWCHLPLTAIVIMSLKGDVGLYWYANTRPSW